MKSVPYALVEGVYMKHSPTRSHSPFSNKQCGTYKSFRLNFFIAFFILLMLPVASSALGQSNSESQSSIEGQSYEQVLQRIIEHVEDTIQFGNFDEALYREISETGDIRYAAPLIDVAYFIRSRSEHTVILFALERLTGQDALLGWQGLFEWAAKENIPLPPGYDTFKGSLLSVTVDPRFASFFQDVQESAQVNLVEAVWGGVTVDGIPSLVNAKQISIEDAMLEGINSSRFCNGADCTYPSQDELVFGVSINGDNRAYPLRLLNWHEMFNDVIGHTPMYDAPNGNQVCNFRAPTEFKATTRTDSLVKIYGESANCPSEGWISIEATDWADDTDWTTLPTEGRAEISQEDALTGQVKGVPVMLAYCTLCGSGILYDATIPELSYTDADGNQVVEQDAVLEFGSTGMLMRSNKLMYDRNTNTVWNALRGTPAFGKLAESGLELEVLPVVVADWSEWLELHPDTSVLSLDTGVRRNYTNGGAYGHYFNIEDLMFPVWLTNNESNENKDMIFGMKHLGTTKAFPLKKLIPEVVTNDSFAGLDLVLVSHATPERDFFEPGGATVRAYERNEHTFQKTDDDFIIVDETGISWQVTEEALISSSGEVLPRLPGHLAFWFGWFSFNPDTLLYE